MAEEVWSLKGRSHQVRHTVLINSQRRDGYRPRGYRVCLHRLSVEGARPGSIPQHPNRAGCGQDGDLRGCWAAPPLHLAGLRSGGLSGYSDQLFFSHQLLLETGWLCGFILLGSGSHTHYTTVASQAHTLMRNYIYR
ncbi:hypothetical protein ILYODFUR_015608 [Ilyodon furcidens]|uniref:Uncharacterized protein n=1 Tax=Ilyodon furcidens TaxID=33524 RepID=A0ABV0T895_9TELE